MNSVTAPGTVQIFTAVYSDPDGWQNIAAADFYLAAAGNNEWLHYLVAPNVFTMMGSNGVCSPGQATTISSGSLTLDCGASSVSGSGTVLTVTFSVTPQPSSSGMQYNIISDASDQYGGANAKFAGTWGIQSSTTTTTTTTSTTTRRRQQQPERQPQPQPQPPPPSPQRLARQRQQRKRQLRPAQ